MGVLVRTSLPSYLCVAQLFMAAQPTICLWATRRVAFCISQEALQPCWDPVPRSFCQAAANTQWSHYSRSLLQTCTASRMCVSTIWSCQQFSHHQDKIYCNLLPAHVDCWLKSSSPLFFGRNSESVHEYGFLMLALPCKQWRGKCLRLTKQSCCLVWH